MPAKFSQEVARELRDTATKIASPGKGILAADESTGTIGKRFQGIGIENSETNRCNYRELLFKTKGIGKYISGAILFEETLYQKTASGEKMVDLLRAEQIIPGIKVDKGVVPLPSSPEESATQGLDNLGERCREFYTAGARFAKWRAVLKINVEKGFPSQISIDETVHTLARYAAICQENRIVPIVEPEILSDGPHSIEVCAEITERVLAAQFKALSDHGVLLEGCLLKPNMVTSGSECAQKADPNQVAFYTTRTLHRTVPPALPGIMFLSGGQSEEEASVNLNTMNKGVKHPYALSFSYGRALQASAIKTWAGKPENVTKAQEVFIERCKANGESQLGTYIGGAGGAAAAAGLHEANYVY